ncbi:MAG: site-2 protease family protein [Deltaproteobacteria bacterium]|nr:site-2 protease family protein [Deltaproteobacteria bacterium]
MESMIQKIAILAPPILLAITLHEYGHGWMANRLGDPTAKLMGRLSLNPLRHLDPMGTLAFFLTQMIGWAKPVPVNPHQLKNPKRDMMWVALAGPVMNLIIAVASALFLKLLAVMAALNGPAFIPVIGPLFYMAQASIMINISLALFNILPIPPLDGSRILAGLLPYRQAIAYARIEPYGFVILILLLMTGVAQEVISPMRNLLTGIFMGGTF